MVTFTLGPPVSLPPDTFGVEMTPVWNVSGGDRGGVAEGTVGTRRAGRSRLFRYEVHCWRKGTIPRRSAVDGVQPDRSLVAAAGSRSARRLRFANWRACIIQCAGSQKIKAMIACTALGRADP